jgi:PEP-CTERM motif
MKSTILKALLLLTGLLAFGSIHHASAATCNGSYTLAAVSAPGFSCSAGFMTFSNFNSQFTADLTSGCGGTGEPTCPSEAPVPNAVSDIMVTFNTLTSGADPFGTVASPGSPITQVIWDYSAGNSVNEFQTEMGVIQYMVTGSGGVQITEADAAITGLATDGATGELNKSLCEGAQFGGGAHPNGTCSTTLDPVAEFLALTNPAGQEADGTPDWLSSAIALSGAGVYDEWDISGGNTDPTSTANVTAVENDFINTPGVPEPGAFAMLGGGLVALGALRRRKQANS